MAGIIGFTRKQFNDLDNLLGEILRRVSDVEERIDEETLEQYVYEWLDEHGATAGYSVTDGDLTITLS